MDEAIRRVKHSLPDRQSVAQKPHRSIEQPSGFPVVTVFLFLKVSDKGDCNSQGFLSLWLPDDLCLVSDAVASLYRSGKWLPERLFLNLIPGQRGVELPILVLAECGPAEIGSD